MNKYRIKQVFKYNIMRHFIQKRVLLLWETIKEVNDLQEAQDHIRFLNSEEKIRYFYD